MQPIRDWTAEYDNVVRTFRAGSNRSRFHNIRAATAIAARLADRSEAGAWLATPSVRDRSRSAITVPLQQPMGLPPSGSHQIGRRRSRLALEPWLVEAAWARLDHTLSPAEQRTIVKATRTPRKVKWPSGGANTRELRPEAHQPRTPTFVVGISMATQNLINMVIVSADSGAVLLGTARRHAFYKGFGPVLQRGLDNPRISLGPVVAVLGEQSHPFAVALDDEAVDRHGDTATTIARESRSLIFVFGMSTSASLVLSFSAERWHWREALSSFFDR